MSREAGEPLDEDPAVTAFFDRLSAAFPSIARMRDEHERDNGELLPCVLLGDVALDAARRYRADPASRVELLPLFDLIEREFTSAPESVNDLIFLGFLESLGGPPNPDWRVRELLGPVTRKAIEGMWPSTS